MPDNTIGWGQGAANNNIEWGKGASNNTIDWGAIYANSPAGDTDLGLTTTDASYQAVLDYATANAITLPDSNESYYLNAGMAYINSNVGVSKLEGLYILGAPNKAFSQINFANPGTNNLTETDAMTHTPNVGSKSSNTTSWYATGISGEMFGIGGIGIQGGAAATQALIGRRNGTTQVEYLLPWASTSLIYGYQSGQYTTPKPTNDATANKLTYGSYHAHHDGTKVQVYYNGAPFASTTVAKAAHFAAEFYVSGANYTTNKYASTARDIGCAYICNTLLTDDEVWHLHVGLNIIRMGLTVPAAGYVTIGSAPTYPAKASTPNLYLIWGQSNADGRALLSGSGYETMVTNVHVATYQNDSQWSYLNNGNHNTYYATNIYYGIEQRFGRLVAASSPTFICKHAQGGIGLDVSFAPNSYDPSTAKYTLLKDTFLRAKNELVREFGAVNVYLIGLHGEQDATDLTTANAYDTNLANFISTLQTDLGITFAGVYHTLISSNASSVTYRTELNAAISSLVGTSLDAAINTDAATVSDGTHYDAAGLETVATAIFNAL